MIYPRIYDVTDIGTDEADFGEVSEETGYLERPMAMACKYAKINDPKRLYVLEDGNTIFLLPGQKLS